MRVIFTLLIFVVTVCGCASSAIKKPALFSFGSSVKDIEALIKPYCEEYAVRNVVPPTGPLVKRSQTQIDCSGFYYAGKDRHIELVFQDDQLDIVWILFSKEERSEMIRLFREAYGEPTMDIEFGTVFLQANAAVRNSPSEVLFASERQVKAMLNTLRK